MRRSRPSRGRPARWGSRSRGRTRSRNRRKTIVPKHGKKYRQSAAKVEPRPYPLNDAIGIARDASYVKFDETLEISLRLGVDPKHADQMVRGTVVLPHGLGKTARVLVFASGEK